MARTKATITLDREKASRAQQLAGVGTLSDVVDAALDRFIIELQTSRDVAIYLQTGQDDLVSGDHPVALDLGDDDVDYEAIYGRHGER